MEHGSELTTTFDFNIHIALERVAVLLLMQGLGSQPETVITMLVLV